MRADGCRKERRRRGIPQVARVRTRRFVSLLDPQELVSEGFRRFPWPVGAGNSGKDGTIWKDWAQEADERPALSRPMTVWG